MIRLRKYTTAIDEEIPIPVLSTLRGGIAVAPGELRKGIEIELETITVQDLAALGTGWQLVSGEFPIDVASALVDASTGRAIGRVIHPACGTEEQLGILRDQLAQILNALGMEATAEFARLNKIAVAKIQKGREAKGLAPDGEKTARLDPSSGLLSKLIAIAAKKG